MEKLLSVVPRNGRNVQVRLPEFKNLLKDKPELYKRLSFHDDFIVIRPDRWDADMHEGTSKFDQIVAESPYLVVDGELPWGFLECRSRIPTVRLPDGLLTDCKQRDVCSSSITLP